MRICYLLFIVLSFLSESAMALTSGKKIYGYVEKTTLMDNHIVLSAKLDTGAKSSSLHAIDIQRVKKNDKLFLRFKVPDKNALVEFTCEYLGKVSIKAGPDDHLSNTTTSIRRPVVKMTVKLGEKTRTIPVNLTNRENYNYPLLLGRDAIILFDGIIDPSQTFTIKLKEVTKNEIQ